MLETYLLSFEMSLLVLRCGQTFFWAEWPLSLWLAFVGLIVGFVDFKNSWWSFLSKAGQRVLCCHGRHLLKFHDLGRTRLSCPAFVNWFCAGFTNSDSACGLQLLLDELELYPNSIIQPPDFQADIEHDSRNFGRPAFHRLTPATLLRCSYWWGNIIAPHTMHSDPEQPPLPAPNSASP